MKALRITLVVVVVLVCLVIGLLGMRGDWIQPVPGVRLEPAGPIVRLSDVKPDSAFAKLTNVLFDASFSDACEQESWLLVTNEWSESVFTNIAAALDFWETNLDAVCAAAFCTNEAGTPFLIGSEEWKSCGVFYARVRRIGHMLGCRAIRKAADGRVREAFSDVACVIRMARIMGCEGNGTQLLVGMSLVSRGYVLMLRLAVIYNVPRDVLEAAMKELTCIEKRYPSMAELLRCDWAGWRSDLETALAGGRTGNLYVFLFPGQSPDVKPSDRTLFITSCLLALNAGTNITMKNYDSYYSHLIDLADKPYNESAYLALVPSQGDGEWSWVLPLLKTRDPVGLMFRWTAGYSGRLRELCDRFPCGIHIASVVLAIRAYEGQTGRSPTTLAELVPAFIDAVPLDPFDGAPLRYVPNTNGMWKVYSIGKDCVDNGGDGDVSQDYLGWGMVAYGPDYVFSSEFGPRAKRSGVGGSETP